MDRVERLRRVGLLCCSFARNCAYYKAGWVETKTTATNEFWLTVQSNFLDTAVLEWLKLFGDFKDKHHWKKIVECSEEFKLEMLSSCNITQTDLAEHRNQFKDYRDKFIAHLDSEQTMKIPLLDTALELTEYYYQYVARELGAIGLANLPIEFSEYYEKCFSDSKRYFGK
jgi:hypothetical protein